MKQAIDWTLFFIEVNLKVMLNAKENLTKDVPKISKKNDLECLLLVFNEFL